MAFQQGLSGLNTSSKALDVIGNNVANSSTVGFKSADAHFADVYAASLGAGGANQIGIGTNLSGIVQQFTQGNVSTTNNTLDIAINGNGFFRLSQNGAISYSRNGQFHLDKNGYIVNDQNLRLTGYPAGQDGSIRKQNPQELQVTADLLKLSPVATGESTGGEYAGARVSVNLDSRVTDKSFTVSNATSGYVAGSAAPNLTYAAAPGETLNISVYGGAPLAVTLTGTYATAADLVTAINTAIGAGGGATASLTSSGAVRISSATTGTASTIAFSGAAVSKVFGSATPTSVAGTATPGVPNVDPAGYNYSTGLTIYDSLGNPHTMTMYFVKTTTVGEWDMYTSVDGTAMNGAGDSPNLTTPVKVRFDSVGQLSTINGVAVEPNPAAGGALPEIPVSIDLNQVATNLGRVSWGATTPLSFNLNLAGTTQFGSAFATNRLLQDGYSSGNLSGLNIGNDGTIQGRYSNGQTRNIGQMVLATFDNPNGLQSIGGNQWIETSTSGQPTVDAPGTGRLGQVQSNAVEESNVDLTSELVKMITQQRNYQANSQTIKTQDQIMQTIVNLR